MDSIETRTCTMCGNTYPLNNNYFYKRGKNKKNIFFNSCKKCDIIRRTMNRQKQCLTVEGLLEYRFQTTKDRINLCKKRKNTRILDFDITLDFLIDLWHEQEGLCYYSGIEMEIGVGEYTISIDRIDSSGGYTKDNVVLVCGCINAMKNSHDIETFISLCEKVVNHSKHLSVLKD